MWNENFINLFFVSEATNPAMSPTWSCLKQFRCWIFYPHQLR